MIKMIVVYIIATVVVLFGFYLLVEIFREKKDETDWEAEAYIDNFNDQILQKQPCRCGLPPHEIRRRVREGKKRTRNIKIPQRHFPNQPPLAKKWRKDLKPEEEEK